MKNHCVSILLWMFLISVAVQTYTLVNLNKVVGDVQYLKNTTSLDIEYQEADVVDTYYVQYDMIMHDSTKTFYTPSNSADVIVQSIIEMQRTQGVSHIKIIADE